MTKREFLVLFFFNILFVVLLILSVSDNDTQTVFNNSALHIFENGNYVSDDEFLPTNGEIFIDASTGTLYFSLTNNKRLSLSQIYDKNGKPLVYSSCK